jgi:hypothetical protein
MEMINFKIFIVISFFILNFCSSDLILDTVCDSEAVGVDFESFRSLVMSQELLEDEFSVELSDNNNNNQDNDWLKLLRDSGLLPSERDARQLAAARGVDSCAVLGNSGSLLALNGHDLSQLAEELFRENLRPFFALPSLTGGRNVRRALDVVWHGHFHQLADASHAASLALTFWSKQNVETVLPLVAQLPTAHRLLFSAPALNTLADQLLCRHVVDQPRINASSGLRAVLYALLRCRHVHLVGFGHASETSQCWPHWWFGANVDEHAMVERAVAMNTSLDDVCSLTLPADKGAAVRSLFGVCVCVCVCVCFFFCKLEFFIHRLTILVSNIDCMRNGRNVEC